MASQRGDEPRSGALEDLVHRLGEQASEFTPAQRAEESAQVGLPGRHPGEHMPEQPASISVAATVILECGTSRRSGYSHVLWVSPDAGTMLGADGVSNLSAGIDALPGVSAHEWEGQELLHLRAAGSDWSDLLESARSVVDAIMAGR